MSDEEIIALLPAEPPRELIHYVHSELIEQLGGEKIIFHRESVTINPGLSVSFIDDEIQERWVHDHKQRWGARCKCTACGEEFITGYSSGSAYDLKSIVMAVGEDGSTYQGWIDKDEYGAIIYSPGEKTYCPLCGTLGEVIPASSMSIKSTYRTLLLQVVNISDLTTLMYWDVSRKIYKNGHEHLSISPFSAITLDGKKLRQYRHYRYDHSGRAYQNAEWRPTSGLTDPEQIMYYSYDANSKKQCGAFIWPVIPDLTGSSGEKTGLAEYLKNNGSGPVLYLKLWKKSPSIENISKTYLVDYLATEIENQVIDCLNYHTKCSEISIDWLNLNEAKPHKILGVNKTDFRTICKQRWTLTTINMFKIHSYEHKDVNAATFNVWLEMLGERQLKELVEGKMDIPKVLKYIQKVSRCVEDIPTYLHHFMEYRRMLRIYKQGELTHEELWPKRIIEAHDRMAELTRSKDDKYQLEFTEAFHKYSSLEWTDGELCIRLPRSNQELVDEGETLRHCVGGYGKNHVSGYPIFFVRKYRRPERSYYTLNINLTGNKPERIQLHGYGNEHHGEHKQYRHQMPKKVLDFCDHWEREVLQPWFLEQQKNNRKRGDKTA